MDPFIVIDGVLYWVGLFFFYPRVGWCCKLYWRVICNCDLRLIDRLKIMKNMFCSHRFNVFVGEQDEMDGMANHKIVRV